MSKDPQKPRKPPLKDRFLNRIPLFGTIRRTRGWMRRNRGWIYLGLVVVVLFIVRPVLMMISAIFEILKGPIAAMLDHPVGSFIFYNVLALLLLWIVWRKVKSGIQRVIGLRAMRAFLDGMNCMIMGRWRAAIPQFQRVVRIGRWVRLEDAVPEHRDIRVDAFLKISACHLKLGHANEAKSWLLRVREKDMLTEHVRRNHAELRALAYDLNDELEAETVLKELERTQVRDRGNRRVLLALRDRLESAGDLDRTRTVAKRLVAVTEGPDQEEAESYLALLEFRLAHKALGEGDTKNVKRVLKARTGDVRAALLLGDQALAAGDVKGALKAWSRAVSLPVFDRIAQLLAEGKLAGDRERALLLRSFPYAGTMIVLAEHYRSKGDFRAARTAIEKVLEAGGEDITVLRLYAACLEGDGDAAQAAELYRRALLSSLG